MAIELPDFLYVELVMDGANVYLRSAKQEEVDIASSQRLDAIRKAVNENDYFEYADGSITVFLPHDVVVTTDKWDLATLRS